MPTAEAIEYVRRRRPIVDPNPGQIAVVRQFETLYGQGRFDEQF